MPVPRLSMRKIREVLRLKHDRGLGHRAVAHACAIGVGTVTLYLQRATDCGVGWPVPTELDDTALEARLFPRAAPVGDPARLRGDPPRAQARRGHAAAPVAGVCPGPSRRLPLQPVLRDLPALGSAPPAVDASGASSRREDLHRLLG